MESIIISRKSMWYARFTAMQKLADASKSKSIPKLIFTEGGYVASTDGRMIIAVRIEDIADYQTKEFVSSHKTFKFDKGYLIAWDDDRNVPPIHKYMPTDTNGWNVKDVMHFRENTKSRHTDLAVTAMRYSRCWLNGTLLANAEPIAEHMTKYMWVDEKYKCFFTDEWGTWLVIMSMNYED